MKIRPGKRQTKQLSFWSDFIRNQKHFREQLDTEQDDDSQTTRDSIILAGRVQLRHQRHLFLILRNYYYLECMIMNKKVFDEIEADRTRVSILELPVLVK